MPEESGQVGGQGAWTPLRELLEVKMTRNILFFISNNPKRMWLLYCCHSSFLYVQCRTKVFYGMWERRPDRDFRLGCIVALPGVRTPVVRTNVRHMRALSKLKAVCHLGTRRQAVRRRGDAAQPPLPHPENFCPAL